MQNLIDIIRNTNVNKYPNAELNNKMVFAIRGEYKSVNVGDVLAASHEWIDNEQTDNQLSGTCACKIVDANQVDDLDDQEIAALIDKALSNVKSYGNNNAVLVYGIDTQEIVNDDFANEVIIDDCTVLAII